MVSVNNWMGLLKIYGGVSQMTKPAISHSNLRNHYVCKKDQGSLGFRLMKDVNLSLISKLG
jgi:hypothetical protein